MNGIKCIRERCNISMSELADRIGVTRQTISLWEKGTRRPSLATRNRLCEFFGLPARFFSEITEQDLGEIDEMKIYRHKTETSEFFTFRPLGNEQPEPYLALKHLHKWNDAKYAGTMKRCRKVLDDIESSFHFDNDADSTLEARIAKASISCTHIEKFMEVLSVIDKTKAERGTYLGVPIRFEIWAVIDAMMIAFGLYTEEELYQKYPYDFLSEHVNVDKDYLHTLAEQIKAHWDTKVEFFTACKNRRFEK